MTREEKFRIMQQLKDAQQNLICIEERPHNVELALDSLATVMALVNQCVVEGE